MQCVFLYIPACRPHYAGSDFAGFLRSAFACGTVLFSRPLYENLGLMPGYSLLAGLTIGCVVGTHALYRYVEVLRR
ncbi:benomyl/methotrexate resistance protein [Aspergillus luchuensis]|uniref:Benomyl/methotrexate resistance protein n=1 Tax=Aspergillus kawachii TaxID=1069201 RepID=A0A146G0C4_ASPKA|nr:benomyl/methotrexate resistance protein [Aspergillus luchuensis]